MYQYMDYLPEVLRPVREFRELGTVIDAVGGRLAVAVTQLAENQYITTADAQTITRLERIYGITPRTGQPLAERRAAVLTHNQAQELVTRRRLAELTTEITGAECAIDEFFAEYRFTIRLLQDTFATINVDFLREQVDIIKPANLLCSIAVEQAHRAQSYMGIAMVKATTTTIREVL